MGKRNIRMLVLGDEGVGKTSLIQSLVCDSFPEDVPPVSNPIQVPLGGDTAGILATIVDTAYRRDAEEDGTIEEELQKADVVLLFYEATRPETMQRIPDYWVPRISRTSDLPIIFVGTKADLHPDNFLSAEEFEEAMRALLRDNKQCETMIECSAKSVKNISDLLICAQRVVMYPSAPLFNMTTRELTPAFVRALKFAFRRFDEDKDRVLSRKELIRFNMEVFQEETPEAVADNIIELIARECPDGVADEGLNFHGFEYLMRLMILRLQMHSCWGLLRHFGYSDSLTLDVPCSFVKPPGQSVRLSSAAFHFLTRVFEQNSRDGVMPYEALKEVFGACTTPPWAPQRRDDAAWTSYDKCIRTTSDLGLTLSSWLSLWWLLVWLDHQNAYTYLWMIGLQLDAQKTFTVVSAKSPCVYVLGASGTGKTSLLESFIRKPFKEEMYPTSSVRCVCDAISMSRNPPQFLILKEVPQVELETLLKTSGTVDECSLVCLLADGSPASIAFLKNPLLTYFRPSIRRVIRTKTDIRSDADFEADWKVKLKVERPDGLFHELFSLCPESTEPSTFEELILGAAMLSLVVVGTIGAIWFIRRSHFTFSNRL